MRQASTVSPELHSQAPRWNLHYSLRLNTKLKLHHEGASNSVFQWMTLTLEVLWFRSKDGKLTQIRRQLACLLQPFPNMCRDSSAPSLEMLHSCLFSCLYWKSHCACVCFTGQIRFLKLLKCVL